MLGRTDAADLGYGDPAGQRWCSARELAGWLGRTRGVRADADDVLVVAGVAQALALLAQVLRAGGARSVAVEDPGSPAPATSWRTGASTPFPWPVDADGLDVAALHAQR